MYGLLQPLTVTRTEIPRADGGLAVEYELIAGERRLRASKIAGLAQVPVIIRSGEETDQMKLELAIIENLQREDLNPIDRAKAFEKLFREFRFSHREIGKKMGRSREYVTNTIRLLALPEAIQQHLSEGRISEGHTRPLLMLNNKPEEQAVLMREILVKRLTVRETEQIARRVAQDRVTEKHRIDPEIIALERALTERLGTRVQIEPREAGGRLVISFFNSSDLQTLLDTFKVGDTAVAGRSAFDGNPLAPSHPEQYVGMGEGEVPLPRSASPENSEETWLDGFPEPEPEPESQSEAWREGVPVQVETPPQVVAAALRPQPEPDVPTSAVHSFTPPAVPESVAHDPYQSAPKPANVGTDLPPAPRPSREESEEDPGLYSVRNFSI